VANKLGLLLESSRIAVSGGRALWRRRLRVTRALFVFALGAAMIAGCAGTAGNQAGADALSTIPTGVTANAAVAQILQNSCYSCHSNGGSAPWYASIAPSYLMSNSARAKMNFSDWNNFDQSTKAQARHLVASVVDDGDMPPLDFRIFHPSAGLSDSDKAVIAQWAAQTRPLPAH